MKCTILSLTILVALFCTMTMQRVSTAASISVSQTIEFSEVLPFGTFSQGTFVLPDWDSPFPFTTVGEISLITFEFSSTDPDFSTAPLGGVSHVEIGVLSEVPSPIRTSLSSVNPTFSSILVNQALLPAFPLVESFILDGNMTMSLGAFETSAPGTIDLTLGESSSLKVTVVGELVPEPTTLTLAILGLLGFAMGRCRRQR